MKTLGIILVFLGLVGLAIETVTFTTSEDVVDIGPLQVERHEERTIPIRPIGAAVAIVGGAGLWFAASRRTQD